MKTAHKFETKNNNIPFEYTYAHSGNTHIPLNFLAIWRAGHIQLASTFNTFIVTIFLQLEKRKRNGN